MAQDLRSDSDGLHLAHEFQGGNVEHVSVGLALPGRAASRSCSALLVCSVSVPG